MGQDKSQLVYRGKSLFQNAMDLLYATGADKVLVSGSVDGYDTIEDILPDCGPLGGLHAVLHALDEEGGLDGSLLLVIPVDMPMLNPDALARLVVSIGEADNCHYDGEIFPCVFRLQKKLLKHLDGLFSESRELGGERSMKALLKQFSEKKVSSQGFQDTLFLNINDPGDWETFRELSGTDH